MIPPISLSIESGSTESIACQFESNRVRHRIRRKRMEEDDSCTVWSLVRWVNGCDCSVVLGSISHESITLLSPSLPPGIIITRSFSLSDWKGLLFAHCLINHEQHWERKKGCVLFGCTKKYSGRTWTWQRLSRANREVCRSGRTWTGTGEHAEPHKWPRLGLVTGGGGLVCRTSQVPIIVIGIKGHREPLLVWILSLSFCNLQGDCTLGINCVA